MVKFNLAYMSYFGNSKRCAQVLHDELSKVNVVEMNSIKEGEKDTGNAEVVIICTPVRMGKVVRKTRAFIKQLSKGRPVRYGLVITHASELDGKWNPIDSVNKMMEILDSAGMERISEPLFIQVVDIKGPLQEGYEDLIRDYAKALPI